MNDQELVKKKSRLKRSSGSDGQVRKSTFPTLAHIVLSNGSRVDIPKLPGNFSELTTYDHMRVATEFAALATSWVGREDSRKTPKLMLSSDWAHLRILLEDLLNHLHYAIEGFPKGTGSS